MEDGVTMAVAREVSQRRASRRFKHLDVIDRGVGDLFLVNTPSYGLAEGSITVETPRLGWWDGCTVRDR